MRSTRRWTTSSALVVAACSHEPHAPVVAAIDAAAPAPTTIARQDGGTWLCPKRDRDECKARCDAGNALSCARYGEQLYFGAGDWHRDAKLEIDRAAARVALERSCDLGYPRACATLGLIVGREIDTDLEDDEHEGDFGGPKSGSCSTRTASRST
jgi:hypothetical protein